MKIIENQWNKTYRGSAGGRRPFFKLFSYIFCQNNLKGKKSVKNEVGKVFLLFENGQKKCPNFKSLDSLCNFLCL